MDRPPLRKSLARVALATGLLLLVPLLAMQFTGEMSRGLFDFAAAGVLLFGAGTAMVLATRRLQRPVAKTAAVVAVALVLAAVWAELAVGIFH